MKRLVLALVVAFGVTATAPAAQALPVTVTYAITGTLALPGLVPALGPPGAGSLTVTYAASSANAPLASLILPPGAPVGLSSGPVHLESFAFSQVIAFAVLGDVFTGMVSAMAGPSGLGSLGGGSLMVPVTGTLMGLIHCTGGTCAVAGLVPSVPTPIGGPVAAALLAIVGLAPTIALSFPFAPIPVASLAGIVITAMLSATEVSRHVTPEPTSLSLLGMGLAGLAIGGWRVRRSRKA